MSHQSEFTSNITACHSSELSGGCGNFKPNLNQFRKDGGSASEAGAEIVVVSFAVT